MCLTHAAFVGIPHANILTYWHRGTSFCILDSTVHPYAFHNDRSGCICAQLSLLNSVPNHSVAKFFDSSRSLRKRLFHLSRRKSLRNHSRTGTDYPRRSARLRVPDFTIFLLILSSSFISFSPHLVTLYLVVKDAFFCFVTAISPSLPQ
jgi:hypothetical protein